MSYVAGYFVSVVVGGIITWFVLGYLYERYGGEYKIPESKEKYRPLPAVLGVLERVLYTTTWLFGPKEFILFWLLAKVGSGWIWSIRVGPSNSSEREAESAVRYNNFLIGNTLSIVFGISGALIIKYWPK